MISSTWPMPQNSKVPKNEKIDLNQILDSCKDPSVHDYNTIEGYFAAKQELISNSSVEESVKNELIFSLQQFLNYIKKADKSFVKHVLTSIEKNLELVAVPVEVAYDPTGPIPFPKSSVVGGFDLDDNDFF